MKEDNVILLDNDFEDFNRAREEALVEVLGLERAAKVLAKDLEEEEENPISEEEMQSVMDAHTTESWG